MREEKLKKLGLSFIDPLGKIIGENASKFGLNAWLVGGTVRDSLLGRKSKDFDICVSIDPSKMKQVGDWVYSQLPDKMKSKYEIIVQREGLNVNLREFLRNCGGGVLLSFVLYLNGIADIAPVIYPRFLVGMIKIGGEDVELVATRTEDYSTTQGEGSKMRNPGNVYVANEYEDAIRRDFTINALYVNLSTGELLDPTGNGLKDLKNGIIRVAREDDPVKVFTDDPLRILRAIRQSAQLGFTIEPKTEQTIRRLVQDQGDFLLTEKLSKERIRDELSKIIINQNAPNSLQKLLDFGVLDYIIPELADFAKDKEVRHKNLWEHTLIVLQNSQITPEIDDIIKRTSMKTGQDYNELKIKTFIRLKLSALFHDIGKIHTRSYGNIKCPKCGEVNQVNIMNNLKCKKCGNMIDTSQVKSGPTFHQHQYMSESISKRILRNLKFDNEMVRWVARDCALHQIRFDDYIRENVAESLDPKQTNQTKKLLVEKLVDYLSDSQPGHDDPMAELNFAVRIYGLIRADSSAHPIAQQQRVDSFIEKYEKAQELRKEEDEWKSFNKPILSGEEIMQEFNVRPGKWIGDIHKRLREDKLNNPEGHTRERALQITQEELDKWGPEIYNK